MKKTLLVFLGFALAACGANAILADDDAFENEMKAAIAQALTDSDDEALEAAIVKAIEHDLARGDDDAEDEIEDGIEQALRAAGKTVDDAAEDAIEAAVERAYYKALRSAAQDGGDAKGAAKAVKGAVRETFMKYGGAAETAAEETQPADALGAAAPANDKLNASLKAALDQSFKLGSEDAFENAVKAAVAYALDKGNDATLKYAVRKALEYDAPTGDDEAGGAIEDGVKQALRLSGKRVTDRVEDIIERAIEHPYFRAMRDVERDANKLDAATDAIDAIVKTTFEKQGGRSTGKSAPDGKAPAEPADAEPMNEAKEAIDLAMKSGNDDAIENAIEAAVADALQNGDDDTLAYALAKAIQFDKKTRDDDGKGAVEDGVETALRALGKRVTDRQEDEIESVVEKALHRRANADFAAKTVKGVFEKLNGGPAAAPKKTDALDAALESGNEDAIEDAIKSAVAQALKTNDGDALEAVIAKTFDYDLARDGDDAEDELEDGVARALRAAGKTVTDSDEDAIEAAIERAYYKALRKARKNPDAVKEQVKAIKEAVKAAYDKFAA